MSVAVSRCVGSFASGAAVISGVAGSARCDDAPAFCELRLSASCICGRVAAVFDELAFCAARFVVLGRDVFR